MNNNLIDKQILTAIIGEKNFLQDEYKQNSDRFMNRSNIQV